MKMMKRLGSLKGIMKMIPGFSSMGDFDLPEKEFKKIEGMINSMTVEEREERIELSHSRKKRIAAGSGRPLSEITKLLDNFEQMKKMVKRVNKLGAKGLKGLPFGF